jgi:predicted HTH domain antitoxin
MEEKGHIISILKRVKIAIRENNVISLKDLSNQTIHSASINQDEISITLAVIIYSISKIIERTSYEHYPNFKDCCSSIESRISKAIVFLEKDAEESFLRELQNLIKDLEKTSGNFKKHIENVFRKARINKASRVYEHGISMEKTSKLLGISLFELAEYAGNTGISDVNFNLTMPVKERIKLVENIFKK